MRTNNCLIVLKRLFNKSEGITTFIRHSLLEGCDNVVKGYQIKEQFDERIVIMK